MTIRQSGGIGALALAALTLLPAFQSAPGPDAELASLFAAFLDRNASTEWQSVEQLAGVRWAPLPPTELKSCLPEGGCYARQGTAVIGGRNLAVIATGARGIVSHLFVRNASAPMGEAAVLAALRQAELAADLARCPVKAGAGGTTWYRVSGERVSTGHLTVQTRCNGRPCEGFVLSRSDRLPPLQPAQLALYSEKCSAGADRTAVSTTPPHVQLAETIKALLPAGAGPALYDWKALAALPTEIAWGADGPQPGNLSYKGDPGPMLLTGRVTLAGREFSAMATGPATQVRIIYLEENGLHPRGEHMLGVLYEKGLAVKLVRCGPVYTESTNNWYSITSAGTRPVTVLQSIRYEGNNVQDSYTVRLDGTLPARDPRDRNPGVAGC